MEKLKIIFLSFLIIMLNGCGKKGELKDVMRCMIVAQELEKSMAEKKILKKNLKHLF